MELCVDRSEKNVVLEMFFDKLSIVSITSPVIYSFLRNENQTKSLLPEVRT